MNRPTRTIETPNGKNKVVVKAWLTAGENQKLQRAFLGNAKTSFNKASLRENPEEAVNLDDMSAEAMLDIQNAMIEAYVVSIDEVKENVLQHALDNLRAEDYEFIITEINAEDSSKKA